MIRRTLRLEICAGGLTVLAACGPREGDAEKLARLDSEQLVAGLEYRRKQHIADSTGFPTDRNAAGLAERRYNIAREEYERFLAGR